MTPKERAEDLFVYFYEGIPDFINNQEAAHIAKDHAKRCAQEIRFALSNYGYSSGQFENMDNIILWYHRVEAEIDNL